MLLKGKIALVTGASRGIGAAVAKAYAQEGAHVILVARSQKGLEETDDAIRAAGGQATLVPLDITDNEKLRQLSILVAQRFGHLDILVGNAGLLGELSPITDTCAGEWDKVMNVNLTANWQLLRCFDALLKTAPAGRAIFVTSGAARKAAAYWGAYAVSKAALETMVRVYAAENAHSSVKANIIDPGGVATRMRAQAFPGEDPASLPAPEDITALFIELASPNLSYTGQLRSVREFAQ